jgi:hypothetical protein
MARIDIRSNGGGSVAEGVLQLENGVALDTTLRSVTDQNNTTSPLKLSTTAVQVNSPLRITTSDASGFYLDAEDSATNNRFSIKRDPSSQEVTLDFASNPAGSTTLVGAIRTYQDGINLSNAMSFIEDGSVGIGTNAPVGILHLKTSAKNTRLAIDGDAGFNRLISYRTGAIQRFGLYVNNTAESSSNVGSDFAIRAYNDAGTLLTTPVFIKRSTGNVGINTLTGTAKLQVVGSGSTGATSSLLVQNSAGTTALEILDSLIVSSANSTLSFTNTSATHRLGNITFSNNNLSCLSTLNIGGNTATSFTNTTLNFQTSTNFSSIASPNNATRTGITIVGDFTNSGASSTSIGNNFNITTALNTSTGNVTLNQFNITNTVNTTGGTTLQRGFYYNPTLTGTVGFTHRAIQTTSGGAYINTATPDATAALQADSTTQGFLPPRMTNVQRAAITSPAIGLMVYCTDAVEGLYVYKSTGWTFVI